MSVGAKRSPTRLLSTDLVSLAFPGELLIDPSTGNFIYVTDNMGQVMHNRPGTLTVTQGQSTVVDHADLSGDVSFSIPDVQLPTFTADRVLISNGTGGMAASSISTTLLEYLTGLSGNIQEQLNDKAASDHNHDGVYLPITGTAAAATKLAAAVNLTIGSTAKAFDGSAALSWTLTEIGAAAANHNHDGVYLPIGGTAAAATKLATAQTITIGSAAKTFDGSAAISFSLAEIGAAAANHTHTGYLATSGGTISGNLSVTGTLSAGSLSGVRKDFSGTLSTSWSGSAAPYTQTVSVSGILSTDRPILDVLCSGTYATDQSMEEAWLNVYRATTAANSITFYAHEKPTVAINFYAQVTR